MSQSRQHKIWSLLTSPEAAQRAQGREMAVQLMPLEKALKLIDRAAREHHLQEVEAAIASAPSLTTAKATLLKHKATLLGLDKPQPPPDPPDADLDPPADPAEHRRQLIRTARRNRMRAEASGANTAAALFFREERTLLAETPTDDDRPAGSDGDLVAQLAELLKELDPADAAELLTSLKAGG